MTIQRIQIRQIFDSRGEPTIEVELLDVFQKMVRASIPSGKSRGSREAMVFGMGEARVVQTYLSSFLVGKAFSSIRALDKELMDADGTPQKTKIGGNVMLGISIAGARMLAAEKNIPLWQLLREEFFSDISPVTHRPLIFSNLINGGVHAKNNLDIQEYMVVVKTTRSYEESIAKLISLYKHLGEGLSRMYADGRRIPIGDEGGYAMNFKDNFYPIAILERYIKEEDQEGIFSLGLDIASSSFFNNDQYYFEGAPRSREEMLKIYVSYFEQSPLLSTIEDPFVESDPESFGILSKKLGAKWVIGDDLTVTNASYIDAYGSRGYINGVIIKPNQIGNVTQTCNAILAARRHKMKTVISHRSGETDDTFIIELAKAAQADAVKIGAPIKERISKFNELIRLFEKN